MPIPLAAYVLFEGTESVPWLIPAAKVVAVLVVLWALKTYFGGARNTADRNMHSKVILMTGGTSGIGASVAHELAKRGAQIVFLTQQPLSDSFLVDYIMDLRTATDNQLITAEHVDLASLHSIRLFATKWIDNAPPRRIDMIILCGNTQAIKGGPLQLSKEGVERVHAVNYLANVHLLSILSPALRAQPPHRDVRIIITTCSAYIGAPSGVLDKPTIPKLTKETIKQKRLVAQNPSAAFATSKLSLMTFANAFQRTLDDYKRPDGAPNNTRVIMVDPGYTRTPGMRRWLMGGSLFGLAFYLLTYPLWWLILKSPVQGAQTLLWAAMEAEFERGNGGRFLKECQDVDYARKEIKDEATQKRLWEVTEKAIDSLEKEAAAGRAQEKKSGAAQEPDSAKSREQTAKQAGSRRSKKAGKS